jgi:hypothetical protein
MGPAGPARSVMHTSRVSSPRYSASRVFFCLETASLYSSPTRLTRLLPQLIFHCATVFYAPRRHSRLLARRTHSPTTLDSPRARLAASCASLGKVVGWPVAGERKMLKRKRRRIGRNLRRSKLGSRRRRERPAAVVERCFPLVMRMIRGRCNCFAFFVFNMGGLGGVCAGFGNALFFFCGNHWCLFICMSVFWGTGLQSLPGSQRW